MLKGTVSLLLGVATITSLVTAASSKEDSDNSQNHAISLRLASVIRAGFNTHQDLTKTASNIFMEQILIPNGQTGSSAESLTWKLDPNFNALADAGGDTFMVTSPAPETKFKIAATKSKVIQWSRFSTRTLKQTQRQRRESDAAEMNFTYQSDDDDTTFSSSQQSTHMIMFHKDMIIPNHTDNITVLALGKMAYNSYYEPDSKDWVAIPGWDQSDGFGSTGSAIRGHVFTSEEGDVVTVVIKGTSLQTPFTGGPTSVTVNDKLNDNKMFSCCCGKATYWWTGVCGCSNSAATGCNKLCLERETDYKESYYRLATSIAHTVQQMYPRSDVWLTGHSLGGALASLTALTFDLPAFTFQAPGDLLFAKRLGLLPPATHNGDSGSLGLGDYAPFLKTLPIYQFGNDADPVYLGQCSASSTCYLSGYALETKCHVGKECVYDQDFSGRLPPPEEGGQEPSPPKGAMNEEEPVRPLKSQSIYNHGIQYLIDRYLSQWEYVPDCHVNALNPDCDDCGHWAWV